MPSLPTPGSGNWGSRLNAWLRVAHNDDGTLRAPGSAPGGMTLQATTGAAGAVLAGGTGTVIGWPVPDDGVAHRAQVWAMLDAAAGGTVTVTFTTPAGRPGTVTVLGPGQVSGSYMLAVKGGTTVSFTHSATAAAAGPPVLYADIWGA